MTERNAPGDGPLPIVGSASLDDLLENTRHAVLRDLLPVIRDRSRRHPDTIVAYYEDAPYVPDG